MEPSNLWDPMYDEDSEDEMNTYLKEYVIRFLYDRDSY